MTEITFANARAIVVAALSEHYSEKFPGRGLVAKSVGRDLGDSWAVFLALGTSDSLADDLIDAPVMLVDKGDGALSVRQIPPSFEILDAPVVRDEGL